MPPRQQQPWASGKHKPGQRRKPPKTAYAKVASKVWANTKSSYLRASRRHPWLNLVLQIVLGLVFVVTLALGSVLQTVLYYLVLVLSGLGQLAIVRARQMERDRQATQPRPRPTSSGPKTPPPPKGAEPPPRSGVIYCTANRSKPIDECECASRHIATEAGRKRYGGNLGDPIGKRKQPGKPTGTV